MTYYDDIAPGYNQLHGEEQHKKIALIKDHITLHDHQSLLDVGCGTGISTALWPCKAKTGVDPAQKLIEIAKQDFAHCSFGVAPAENLPFEDNSFDVVVSLTAIQNFEDLDKGLQEIYRVGKGIYILTFLKKSPKRDIIEQKMLEIWPNITFLEEEKDIVGLVQ